ncbi:MAG: replication and repair protein RecF [Ilumatobacteraceae bacterium]|jgi:DNA replication and repair protein RecF
MIVSRLELVDFRNYVNVAFDFQPGTTAIVGSNGQGKTNLAEAMAYLATLDSFRDAPVEAMIRVGADTAVVRATVLHDDGREVLIELELTRNGRNRVLVNRQRLGRARDLLGVMRVTVFSPDDLAVVKEGPGERRRFLDDVLVSLALKYDALRLELDRVVKQRNMLLKQLGGRLNTEAALTLDVWDSKMADVGDQFGHARAVLIARLGPLVTEAYEQLADRPTSIELRYEPAWRQRGLTMALAEARDDDVRRAVSTVGPHRDDLELFINGMPARTHASQGEQRTLALALRLGAHRLVTDKTGSAPVLVLDDVLSELDPARSAALLQHLPPGQVVLTTAGVLPEAAHPDAVLRIEGGMVMA